MVLPTTATHFRRPSIALPNMVREFSLSLQGDTGSPGRFTFGLQCELSDMAPRGPCSCLQTTRRATNKGLATCFCSPAVGQELSNALILPLDVLRSLSKAQ